MRHFVLTRAVYGPDWPKAANRRRLALLRGVTAASLWAQRERRFEWLVLVHPDDPLLKERMAACEQAGCPVTFGHFAPRPNWSPAKIAAYAYRAAFWRDEIGPGCGPTLTTRLDDDDALGPYALGWVRRAARRAGEISEPVAWMLTHGFRVWEGRFDEVEHDRNAWVTLHAPPGSDAVVYDFNHKRIADHVEVRVADERPAWLWVRHDDTLSRHRKASEPIDHRIVGEFPGVNWDLLR